MKIIVDRAIPFVEGVFEPYAAVEYLPGAAFCREVVEDATALMIRTRTRCTEALLGSSSVRHIASATIGFDHIDTAWCDLHSVGYSTAAGCNARGVLQWFAATMAYLSQRQGWQPCQRKLGIVGVGNVGALIEEYALLWGFEVICCDPPRQESEGNDKFVSLEELLTAADIITLHTPLDDSTRQMIDARALLAAGSQTTIINCSRGEVVDTQALLAAGNPFVMDVWEGEPSICSEALERALLATPHIAGYSLQGKANASQMAVRSIAHALGLPLTEWSAPVPKVAPCAITWEEMCATIATYCDIAAQSAQLKENRLDFEELRNNYDYRTEYF